MSEKNLDIEQLDKLARLHASGSLTDEEFQIAKRHVLAFQAPASRISKGMLALIAAVVSAAILAWFMIAAPSEKEGQAIAMIEDASSEADPIADVPAPFSASGEVEPSEAPQNRSEDISPSKFPTSKVYQGSVKFPDFNGRDKSFSYLKTKIIDTMKDGVNFSYNYSIIRVGCGTGCSLNFVADVSTGKVYEFPYGGEEYYTLDIRHSIDSNILSAQWVSGDQCIKEDLEWNGSSFRVLNHRVLGGEEICNY